MFIPLSCLSCTFSFLSHSLPLFSYVCNVKSSSLIISTSSDFVFLSFFHAMSASLIKSTVSISIIVCFSNLLLPSYLLSRCLSSSLIFTLFFSFSLFTSSYLSFSLHLYFLTFRMFLLFYLILSIFFIFGSVFHPINSPIFPLFLLFSHLYSVSVILSLSLPRAVLSKKRERWSSASSALLFFLSHNKDTAREGECQAVRAVHSLIAL